MLGRLSVGDGVAQSSFIVDVEGYNLGLWRTCDLGTANMKYDEVPSGGINSSVEIRRGRLEWGPIRLSRYVNSDTARVGRWISDVARRGGRGTHGRIVLCTGTGDCVEQFTFYGALPARWTLPSLDVDSTKGAVETLEIMHDGFEF